MDVNVTNIIEKAKKTYERDIITSTNFLDPQQLKLVEYELKKASYKYSIIRVNEDVERVIIVFLPSYLTVNDININDFISSVKINVKKGQQLQHRDYMGAIYNSGVKSECIGDIFVYEDCSAIVFCIPNIAEYLKYNLFKIGKYEVSIDVEKIENVILPEHLYKKIEINVPSNRVDNIVSESCKMSRNKIVEKINDKQVFVNYEVVFDKSKSLQIGDIFSVRGVGKFKISKFIGTSKKGNLLYEIKQYV